MNETGYGSVVTKAPPIEAIIINPNDTFEIKVIDQDLRTMREQIGGGYLEVAANEDQVTIWCDEEGKVHGQPLNRLATYAWWKLQPYMEGVDHLRGIVMILGGVDGNGDCYSVHPEVKRLVQALSAALEGPERPEGHVP